MHKIIYAGKFLKDFKKYSKSGINFKEKLNDVIEFLESKSPLPDKYKDHKLNGEWSGYRECHILFDLLLVYFELRNYQNCHSRVCGNPESASNTLDPRLRGDDRRVGMIEKKSFVIQNSV